MRDEPLLAAVGGSHVSALWQCCCKFLCVRTGWHGFGLWPDDPLVAHWSGGMRGVRGVNNRSSGSWRPMPSACIFLCCSYSCRMHAYVCFMLLCNCAYVWSSASWLQAVVVHVHASRSSVLSEVPIPVLKRGASRASVVVSHALIGHICSGLSVPLVWLCACQRVVCRHESTTHRGPGLEPCSVMVRLLY